MVIFDQNSRPLFFLIAFFQALMVASPACAHPQNVISTFKPFEIRKHFAKKNYDGFQLITKRTLTQSDLKKKYLLLGQWSYVVDNPLLVDESNPVVHIHGVDRMKSKLVPKNPNKPLFHVVNAQYVNFTNFRLAGFNQSDGVNLKVDGDQDVVVDVIDCFIEKGAFKLEAPGAYRLQGNYFTGQGMVSAQIVVDHPGADLFVFGGNITRSGINTGNSFFDYCHVHVKAGRFRIFGTGVQGSRGVADFRIDAETSEGLPHQIVNVRSEGNKALNSLGSSFVYAPPSDKVIDIDVVNCAGSWVLSGTGKSSMAMYNAAGTLRLIGNSSAAGAGSLNIQKEDTNYRGLFLANSLSKSPVAINGDGMETLHPYNLSANTKRPFFFLVSTAPDRGSPELPFDLDIEIPDVLSRPIIESPLPGMLNVKSFGAKGDGVVDDTVALQRAFDAGSMIYFPSGHYRISRALRFNANSSLAHGSGGYIAGSGSDFVVVERYNGGSVFETLGMAYATVQGITFKSKKDYIDKTGSYAVLNLEFTQGYGHATQSNSFYDIAITDANIGLAVGNMSPQQCSENIFVDFRVRRANTAVSIGSYNALANIFVRLNVKDVGIAVGHCGHLNGGTWSVIDSEISGVSDQVFKLLNSSDGIFFFDNLVVKADKLFETYDTGAPFNLFFNKSNLSGTVLSLKSSGGLFFNSSEFDNIKINAHGAVAHNYIINNSKYRLRESSNIKEGTLYLGR